MPELTEREITLVHALDDTLGELGKLRRVVDEQIYMLDNAAHALRSERYDVALEYVERAETALRNARAKEV